MDLRPYQSHFVHFQASRPRVLMDWPPGVGKTFGAAVCLSPMERSLIVCPPSLVHQWSQWFEAPMVIHAGESRKTRLRGLGEHAVTIIGFNLFRSHAKDLTKHHWDTIVFDEAQILRNPKSKTWKTLYRMNFDKLILLSGSIIDLPEQAYGICKVLKPEAYKSFQHFKRLHIAAEDFFGKPLKYKNLDLLERNLFENAHRVSKDVLNLPTLNEIEVPWDLKALDKRAWNDYISLVRDWFIEKGNEIIDFNSAIEVFVQAQILIDKVALDLIKTLIDQDRENYVLFTRYVETTEFFGKKLGCPMYYGAHKDPLDFSENRVIVINMAAGGVGIDGLQRKCNNVIFVDMPFTPSEYQQALSRVYRSGQKRVTNVWLPYAKKTIHEKLLKRRKLREDQLNELVRMEDFGVR